MVTSYGCNARKTKQKWVRSRQKIGVGTRGAALAIDHEVNIPKVCRLIWPLYDAHSHDCQRQGQWILRGVSNFPKHLKVICILTALNWPCIFFSYKIFGFPIKKHIQGCPHSMKGPSYIHTAYVFFIRWLNRIPSAREKWEFDFLSHLMAYNNNNSNDNGQLSVF